jgi:acetyl-CoA carboxylase biotin carboxyl carrier protein
MNDRMPQAYQTDANDGDDHKAVAALVRQFISMMRDGNISRLKLEYGELRLSLRAHESSVAAVPVISGSVVTARHEAQVVEPALGANEHVVSAPMIGTFYEASAPGEPAFVQVGDRVEEGQTVAIIEAMKIMNEIAADRAGTVTEILVKNGQTVEYGTALIKLDVDG